MNKYLVYFQEKQNAQDEWESIQGVTLTVEAYDQDALALEVERQLESVADYQVSEMGIEASYRASWTLESGNTRVQELIPASMWGE